MSDDIAQRLRDIEAGVDEELLRAERRARKDRKRIRRLEARVAVAEKRLRVLESDRPFGLRIGSPDATDWITSLAEPSNSPGGLGDAPDNTPGGDMCEAVHASGLVCTLGLNHGGARHVATGGPGMVLQTWTDPDEAMPSGCFDCDGTTCRCADPDPVRIVCDAGCPGDVGGYYSCDLPKGHDGLHDNNDGVRWADPEPVAEVIDAQIVCGVSRIIDGVMRYCDSGADHAGEHVSEGRARRTWTDPEPVPQWRAMVDSWTEDGVMGAADRRPHWDDALLDAVQRQLSKPMPADQPVLRLYAVIAAVEDWVLHQPILDWHVTTKHAQDKAEVQRLTAALADRDRRIKAALAECQGTCFARCNKSLRGES